MKQFVSCIALGQELEETILLSLDAIRSIRRYYRDERGDIVEDYAGHRYECWRPAYEGDTQVGYDNSIEQCIVTVGNAI